MMQEREDYRKHIEEIGGKYRDDMGGMNWSTAFRYRDRWDVLPGGRGSENTHVLDIPPIVLDWSEWVSWNALTADTEPEGEIAVPHEPGVYEVKYQEEGKRLTIGQGSDLDRRVRQQLVRGSGKHSTRDRMEKAHVDFSRVVVRWAVTNWQVVAEAVLHRQHEVKFGCPPVHTVRT